MESGVFWSVRWDHTLADPVPGSQAQPHLWRLCWSLSDRNVINLSTAGSDGELAKGESSVRREVVEGLLGPDGQKLFCSSDQGEQDCELCRRTGENWKSSRKSKAPVCSFGILFEGRYHHAMASCWKRQIPNYNERQRFWEFWDNDIKQDKHCHKRHRSSTGEADPATKLCREAPSH